MAEEQRSSHTSLFSRRWFCLHFPPSPFARRPAPQSTPTPLHSMNTLSRSSCSPRGVASAARPGPARPGLKGPARSSARLPAPTSSPARGVLHASATAAPAAPPLADWASIQAAASDALADAYTTRPGLVPASSPNPALPTPSTGPGPAPSSTAPILFARDTHGWCPFAQRVWLALTHLGAPFEVVFINLKEKPAWYPALVPTAKVPALMLATPSQLASAGPAGVPAGERELVFESLDILARLDADYPGGLTPPGTDARAAERALALADSFGGAGYGLVRSAAAAGGAPPAAGGVGAQAPPPLPLADARAAFEAALEEWEVLLTSTPGPFLAGPAVSLADWALAPMAERLASTVPASPAAGTSIRGRPDKPAIEGWFAAMEAVPAYAAVRGDPATHRAVFGRVAGLRLQGPAYVPKSTAAAGEAAAKLAANRGEIVADTLKNAGLASGGEAAVEAALLRIATCLVTGLPGQASDVAADNAVTAAVAAFLPARVSAPRDMSGGAAVELRSACARVLEGCYTGI